MRLSYSPKMDVLKMGLDGIESVINGAREMGQKKEKDGVAIQGD